MVGGVSHVEGEERIGQARHHRPQMRAEDVARQQVGGGGREGKRGENQDVVGGDRAHEPGQGAAREVGERLQVGTGDLPGPELLDDDEGIAVRILAREGLAAAEEALGGRERHRRGHEQCRGQGHREGEAGSPGDGQPRRCGSRLPRHGPELTVKAGLAGESMPLARTTAAPGVLNASMLAAPRRATMFLLAALAWSLGLFALLRTPWVEERLVLPLTQLQKQAADTTPEPCGAGCRHLRVQRDRRAALCLAAILACPVPWRARLVGAAGGIAFILGLNTVRIATLGHAAASPALFRPSISRSGRRSSSSPPQATSSPGCGESLGATRRTEEGDTRRRALPAAAALCARAAVLLVAFALCGPWIARSEALLEAGAWTARAAAFFLSAAGLAATASGNVLATSRGAFMVTPECLATALIPLYVAGVLAARLSWPGARWP